MLKSDSSPERGRTRGIKAICAAFDVSATTVTTVRKAYGEGGLEFEFRYTPKHGSWLNMAEMELSALVRTCLNCRIPDQATLHQEAQAWADERNRRAVRVDWRFTTADARIKLKHLYPKIQDWQSTTLATISWRKNLFDKRGALGVDSILEVIVMESEASIVN